MVYVKPTSSMEMKAGKHVNRNGNVYLAYLTEWKHVSLVIRVRRCECAPG